MSLIDTSGRDAKALDQRLRGLQITELRLDFDEVAIVFVGRVGGQRRFGQFQLLM